MRRKTTAQCPLACLPDGGLSLCLGPNALLLLPGIYPPAHASVAVIPNSIADRSERGLLLIAGDSICRRSEGS